MTSVKPETTTGGRRHSAATREKLRVASQARWAAMTPEQQEAQRARLLHIFSQVGPMLDSP